MSDYVIRATAADGQIRAFAATTRDMVEEARRRHDTSPVITAPDDGSRHDGQHDERRP